MDRSGPMVEVQNLCKHFPVSAGLGSARKLLINAVNDVSFSIRQGETLGLVGESGCGKTTLGKTILRLYEPTSGKVVFMGNDLGRMRPDALRAARRDMQIVFQDPYASLNARMSVGSILQEPIRAHGLCPKDRTADRVNELLSMVGLRPFHSRRYPHEFSGGQRQRISIARALSVNPKFIVCDEPVSALDVSVQSQILNLLSKLKRDLGLTYLFISHDLAVIRHISDRVGVMYLGRIVELADEADLFRGPLHPYTRALFEAMPVPRVGAKKERTMLRGDLPSPVHMPSGCAFHERCPDAMSVCAETRPELSDRGGGHFCACHRVTANA